MNKNNTMQTVEMLQGSTFNENLKKNMEQVLMNICLENIQKKFYRK